MGLLDAVPTVRPVRGTYTHRSCGHRSTMSRDMAAIFARSPRLYTSVYCCSCRQHRPTGEFAWADDGTRVGS
jgi:hypothetical protein